MKKTTKRWTTAAALVAAGICAQAQAVPTQWTDTKSFGSGELLNILNPLVTFTHNVAGLTPGVDSVYSYTLSLDLFDDGDRYSETAVLVQPGPFLLDLTNFGNLSGAWEVAQGNVIGNWWLQSTGSLTVAVTIGGLFDDFYLRSSTLTVDGDKKSVPEPGTLALFGAALVGFGLMRRKRQEA